MKLNKKSVYIILLSVLVFSSIPNYTLAIETFADYFPLLTEANDGEYMLVYERDFISNEVVYDQELRSRTIRQTPTEFQTIEIDDTTISKWDIEYDDVTISINHTALIKFGDTMYLLAAAEESIDGNLTFIATETEDNGATWEDWVFVQNTTLAFDAFYNFDVTHRGSNLYMAYSYNQAGDKTQVIQIDPISFNVLSETQASNYFGYDFKLYAYSDRVYITSTEPLLKDQVRVTYTLTGNGFEGPTLLIDAPQQKTEEFNPTMVRWNDGFFLAAQDMLTDEFNPAQNITFDEFFLWGAWFEDVDEPGSLVMHNVVKNVADGYFRKDPSLSVYEGRIFLSYQVGEGSRFGSGGTPDVTFAFSNDAQTWTTQFIGNISIILNPGAYFVIATLGCFIIAIPSLHFFDKYKKGK
jgi:hypothetical protein